jgi:hypothetical protein
MSHVTKRTFGPLLFAGVLICFGYIAAQQNPSQQSGRTQSVKPQSTQATLQQQGNGFTINRLPLGLEHREVGSIHDLFESKSPFSACYCCQPPPSAL